MEHLGADSPCNMDSFVDQLYFYVLSLLEKRACSASKMNCGPEAYAGLLSHDAEQAQRALDLMMSDWKALVLLEQSQTNQLIAGDLRIAIPIPPVMRVIFQLCEQGFHDQARELLKPILVTFPDTKCIEDIHGVIRNDARLNINKRQTFAQVQRCILGSSALESREVPHPVALTKNVFKRRWKRTRGGPLVEGPVQRQGRETPQEALCVAWREEVANHQRGHFAALKRCVASCSVLYVQSATKEACTLCALAGK